MDPAAIDALWDFDDPAASEARFREAVAAATSMLDRSELRTQLGRAIGLQGRHDEARAEVANALEMLDDSVGATRVRVRCLLESGRIARDSGDIDGAWDSFESAWDRARSNSFDELAVDAAHMLAIVSSGEVEQRWARAGIAVADASEDPRAQRWRSRILNNLGWTAFEAGEFTTALEQFTLARDAREAEGDARGEMIARWTIARTLRELGRADEALVMQEQLAAEHAAAGTDDPKVGEEIAACREAIAAAAAAGADTAQ